MAASASKARFWRFTEYDVEDIDPGLWRAHADVRYCVWQKEKCPTTGRIHFQGYLQLKRQQRLGWMKKRLSPTANWGLCDGTPESNRIYCTKEESRIAGPWHFGEMSHQGDRNDLKSLARSIVDDEKTPEDIAFEAPEQFVRYHRGLRELHNAVHPAVEREFDCIEYYVGETGIGKTYTVRKTYPTAYWAHDNEHGWFDRYRGQTVCVFDEFQGKWPLPDMLSLCSEAPLALPIKGSYVPVRVTKVVFTSNLPLSSFYRSAPWDRRLEQYGVEGSLIPRPQPLQPGEPPLRSLADLIDEFGEPTFTADSDLPADPNGRHRGH